MLSTNKSNRGFTIVELLIVIVVIAILAAITMVAYNGVQNRARTVEAQANAKEVIAKADVYAADHESTYPTVAELEGVAAPDTAALSEKIEGLLDTVAPTSTTKSVLQMVTCTTTVNPAAVGAEVVYWDYSANAPVTLSTGTTEGTNCDD